MHQKQMHVARRGLQSVVREYLCMLTLHGRYGRRSTTSTYMGCRRLGQGLTGSNSQLCSIARMPGKRRVQYVPRTWMKVGPT